MKTLFQRNPLASHGLVMVFPDQDASIWDEEINGLVEAVESSVDGACVTLALVNGRQPSLVDALSATRFSGCSSAVVVVVEPQAGESNVRLVSPLDSEFPITVTACRRDAQSVAGAYIDSLMADTAICA